MPSPHPPLTTPPSRRVVPLLCARQAVCGRCSFAATAIDEVRSPTARAPLPVSLRRAFLDAGFFSCLTLPGLSNSAVALDLSSPAYALRRRIVCPLDFPPRQSGSSEPGTLLAVVPRLGTSLHGRRSVEDLDGSASALAVRLGLRAGGVGSIEAGSCCGYESCLSDGSAATSGSGAERSCSLKWAVTSRVPS